MEKNVHRKYLVFGAHADDLDFGCAATVAQLTHEGSEVIYCILTNGEKGTQHADRSKDEMALVREKEQCAAGAAVGVKDIIFLNEKDGELEHTLDVRKKVVRVIREVQPHVIVSLDPGNHTFENFYRFHRDHRMAAEIVFDAIYPAAGSKAFFPELAGKEAVMPHQIDEVWFYGSDKPNHFVDITNTIDKKIAALHCHESQFDDFVSLEKRVRERAQSEGKKANMEMAEGFRKVSF